MKKISNKAKLICIAAGSILSAGAGLVTVIRHIEKEKNSTKVYNVYPWEVI